MRSVCSFRILLFALGIAVCFYVVTLSEAKNKIDINHASSRMLQSIPGIGPAYAARIVAEREKRKGFRDIRDLLKVRGIGKKMLKRVAPYVKVTPYRTGSSAVEIVRMK